MYSAEVIIFESSLNAVLITALICLRYVSAVYNLSYFRVNLFHRHISGYTSFRSYSHPECVVWFPVSSNLCGCLYRISFKSDEKEDSTSAFESF